MPPIPPTSPSDPEWDANWQETSQIRDWWTLYRCSYGTTIPGGFFGVMDATAQSEIHDAAKAFQLAAYNAGYRVDDPQVESERACPDGINGATCLADGTDCSLHNYGVALDPEQSVNPHLYTAYPLEATLFAACKWTKAQVQAVEAIKNTQGDQMWRWLGWSIGDTQHWQINVAPENTAVDWSTVPGANVGQNIGATSPSAPYTEGQAGNYAVQEALDPDNFTPGATYLLMCSAQVGGSNAAGNGPSFDIGIGATATGVSDRLNERSRLRLEPDVATVSQQTDGLERYFFFDVVTIPQFPVAYTFRMQDQSIDTAYADHVQWSWVRLDDLEYYFAEDETGAAHVVDTPTDRASVTFTPSAGDFLLMGHSTWNIDTMSRSAVSRLVLDGGNAHTDLQTEGEDTVERRDSVHVAVAALTAASHTLKTQTWDVETAVTAFDNDYTAGAVFALKLDDLDHAVLEQVGTPTHDATNDWHSVALVSGNAPAAAGDYLLLSHIVGDIGNSARYSRSRAAVAGTPAPTGRDANGAIHSNDATDKRDDTFSQVVTLAGGDALTLEGWVTSNAGWVWSEGIMVVMRMQSAAYSARKLHSRGQELRSGA